jgi:uroporphyrinogen-III synthase
MPTQPLAGRRVLVTRAVRQASKLSDGLRALGAEPVEVPVLEICAPSSFAPLDQALRQLNSYNWLIVTSANTVRALSERAATLGISRGSSEPECKESALKGHDFSRAKSANHEDGALAPEGAFPQVAAIGGATAAAARKAGLPVILVPENYVAESLVEALLHHLHEVSGHGFSRAKKAPNDDGALAPEESFRGQRILLARAEIARDVIPDALRAAGAQVDVVDAYRNAMPANAPELLRRALSERIDAATFTSSSSVTHLAEAAKRAGIAFPFPSVLAISIGPITSATLRELGWEPASEAKVSDIAGLIEAVAQVLR